MESTHVGTDNLKWIDVVKSEPNKCIFMQQVSNQVHEYSAMNKYSECQQEI